MMTNSSSLHVYWDQDLVGTLLLRPTGRMAFTYAEPWLQEKRIPISLSLSLRPEPYEEVGHNFFANLLPEGDYRRRVEKLFQVSEDNDFSLLQTIGQDCAGALTIASTPPNSEQAYYSDLSLKDLKGLVETEGLKGLRGDEATRLSLAGAQGKLALHREDGKFQQTFKGAPSTIIVKFNKLSGEYPRLVENEYFLTRVAHYLGLNVIQCELFKVGDAYVLVSERYDRKLGPNAWPLRLHQEDFCQALGLPYYTKYEKENGPSLKQCIELARSHLDIKAVGDVINWLLFNYFMGNSDAHGKNVSILYDDMKKASLAPFYDLVCTRAYEAVDPKMAMAIGGQYDAELITKEHFGQLAKDTGVTLPFLTSRIKAMAASLPQAVEQAKQDVRKAGIPDEGMQHVYLMQAKILKRRTKTANTL